MDSSSIVCPLCKRFQSPTLDLLWPHIRLVHATEPGFHVRCNLDGCSREFSTMKSYDNHISKIHFKRNRNTVPQNFLSNVHEVDEINDCENSEDSGDLEEFNVHSANLQEDLLKAAAKWILKVKETCKLTETAMEEIVQGVTDFQNLLLTKLYEVLKSSLSGNNLSINDFPQLVEAFQPGSPFTRPFQGVETSYQQQKYYKEQLGLVVSN